MPWPIISFTFFSIPLFLLASYLFLKNFILFAHIFEVISFFLNLIIKSFVPSSSLVFCTVILVQILFLVSPPSLIRDFPGVSVGKEPTCQCRRCRRHRRCGFNSWVRKITRRRKWHLTHSLLLTGHTLCWTHVSQGTSREAGRKLKNPWGLLTHLFSPNWHSSKAAVATLHSLLWWLIQ